MFGTILNFGRTATHKAEIRFVTSDIGELCDMKIPQNPKHPSDKKKHQISKIRERFRAGDLQRHVFLKSGRHNEGAYANGAKWLNK